MADLWANSLKKAEAIVSLHCKRIPRAGIILGGNVGIQAKI